MSFTIPDFLLSVEIDGVLAAVHPQKAETGDEQAVGVDQRMLVRQ